MTEHSSGAHYTVTSVFDWNAGFRNGPVNPLFVPESCILAGENVDAGSGYIKARGGWATTAIPLPSESPPQNPANQCDVRVLKQAHFSAWGKSYVFAHLRDYAGRERLLVCPANNAELGQATSWREIATFEPGADRVDIAVLKDRAVITEGVASSPLVFAGGLSDDGSDWAIPSAVFITTNGGTDWRDVTQELCDPDPDTFLSLSGLQPGLGMLAVCLDLPQVAGFFLDIIPGTGQASGLIVEGYSGAWTTGAGWSDGTGGLTKTGAITYNGDVFSAQYYIESDIPGFWFRFRWTEETPPGVALKSIRFQAPCQPLPVIGDRGGEVPSCFIYWDDSDKSAKDFTSDVSDESGATYARLNDGADTPTAMGSADAIYVCCKSPFKAVDITPHNDFNNRSASAASAAYWNGTAWSPVSGFLDKTQEPPGKSFAKKGRLSWNIPVDWKANSPISPQFPHGYWIRIKVSSNLTARTYLAKVRVWPQPDPLKKYHYAFSLRDRLILCGRSDAPDAVDISKPLDPTGFSSGISLSTNLGGSGTIVAAVAAFNQAYIAQPEAWIILSNQGNGLSVERAETASQVPINNSVVVRAPHTEADSTNIMGLYFLNQSGAWYFSDKRLYQINHDVSWWDPCAKPPRLDLESLAEACGVYWPQKNRVVWAVPMTLDGSRQVRNNRLIIYDLKRKQWLTPFTVSAASLSVISIYSERGATANYGPALYAGDYSGRVIRLFGPAVYSDDGSPVSAWLETGWLHLGSPHATKIIRTLGLFGWSAAGLVTVSIAVDGSESPAASMAFSLSPCDNSFFWSHHAAANITGRLFRIRLDFQGPTEIYGLQIASSVVREWPAG